MNPKVFILVFIFSIGVTTIYANPDILAFVDAGSSGSRIHFYNSTTVPPTEIKACEQRNRVRLGDVYGQKITPEKYGEALVNLFPGRTKTPKGCEVTTASYIVIQSTAGSRVNFHQSKLTNEERRSLEEAIERSVEKSLQLEHNSVSLTIISGRFEGLYGWIDAQYTLNEAFTSGNKKDFDTKLICGENVSADTCSRRLVFYDLGGMSSQLAWTMKNSYSTSGCKNVGFQSRLLGAMRVKISQVIIPQESPNGQLVYSKSFLGNGMTRFSSILTNDSPCWLKNIVPSNERYGLCKKAVQDFMANTTDLTPEGESISDQWDKVSSQISCDEANGVDAIFVAATLTHYFGILNFKSGDGVKLTQSDYFFNSRNEWSALTHQLCSHTMNEKQSKDEYFFNVCGAFVYLEQILERINWNGKIFVSKTPKWVTGSILYETKSGVAQDKISEMIRYPSFNVNAVEDQPFDQLTLKKRGIRNSDRSWIKNFFENSNE